MPEQILTQILELEQQSAEHRHALMPEFSDLVKQSEGRVSKINEMVSNLIKAMESQDKTEERLIELIECKERRIKFVEDQYTNLMQMYKDLLKDYQTLARIKSCENQINVNKQP